jgi:hypothetical protein
VLASTLVVVAAEAPAPAPQEQWVTPAVLGGAIASLVLVLGWKAVQHALTAVHEGGHAFFGSASGAKVTGVTISRSGSGLTEVAGVGPLGRFFTTLAGYLGPSMFGLAGAFLLVHGHTVAVLWLSLGFLAILLVQIRNVFGALVVVATGGLLYLVVRHTAGTVQASLAFAWIWILLIGGFVDVIGLAKLRRRGRESGRKDTSSDAYALRKLTFLPASLWVGLFWLLSLMALIYGAGVLLGLATLGR